MPASNSEFEWMILLQHNFIKNFWESAMNTEILKIAEQVKDCYEGKPWFGKSVKTLLKEVNHHIAFLKPDNQHSIVELLWHMILWREFTINRLRKDDSITLQYFDENDWRQLNHNDVSLWKKGIKRIEETQSELIEVLQQQQDELLLEIVPGKEYDFSQLLYGIMHHDIYHIGQIAYLNKMLNHTL
jgi:hypothetical protein